VTQGEIGNLYEEKVKIISNTIHEERTKMRTTLGPSGPSYSIPLARCLMPSRCPVVDDLQQPSPKSSLHSRNIHQHALRELFGQPSRLES